MNPEIVKNIASCNFLIKSLRYIKVYIWAKSKTSVFATDGIWVTFSVVLNFLLLDWTPWMGFRNERLMCFHNRQKRHGHSWACCYSNTICKCNGRNRLFHFFRPSHFKDCVAIAICLIVALCFPFLFEVCWLLYCVVYALCKITQPGEAGQLKMYFCDGQNFRAKFRPSHF